MARGTVVGWAPLRDTGSARMQWWGTAGSLLPGVAQGQAESPPPGARLALGPSRRAGRGMARETLGQGDERGNALRASTDCK